MKILMVLTYYYPHWTGLTAFAQRMAEGLVRRGHQVTVLTSRFRKELPLQDEHNGVRIVRLRSWFRLSRGQVMPGFVGVARRLIREHDVVQVHTPMLEAWLVGILAHRAGRKMLMTHHGDLVMPAGSWNQFVQLTVGYLQDRGASTADVISTYSQDYIDHSDYLQPHAQKVVPIYPPVEFPCPDEEAARQWRKSLSLDGAPLIGFAGRFVEEKGFDYLLKALPLIVERFPDVHLAYAGEAAVYEGFYARCKPLIDQHSERITMLGLITDPRKMADFYAMCDVFALPSRTDAFASVQVEAMLCGTPLVTTNIPGAREVLRVTGMGRLVEPGDEVALADGLVEVLRHREHYVKPREQISEVFCAKESISRYERLLASLAKG